MSANKHLSIGALNAITREYVYPKIANKMDKYSCPECNKSLILCKGKIKLPYFRHKAEKTNPCNYYSSPTESQIHKDAKQLLKKLLEEKVSISLIRECVCCKTTEEFAIPETDDSSCIEIEHRFDFNGLKIADVAYLDNNEILCIFEICNSHKTQNEKRPEPWFEIDAEAFITSANKSDNAELKIQCVRNVKCETCIDAEQKKYPNKNEAIQKLLSWFNRDNKLFEDPNIYPFIFRDFNGAHEFGKYEGEDDYLTSISYATKPDIVIYDKSNIRYFINVTPVTYSQTDLKICEDYFIKIYYVNIDWILKQTATPTKIKCVHMTSNGYNSDDDDEYSVNLKSLIFLCLDQEFEEYNIIDYVYFNVEFGKKDLIKEYRGTWDSQLKLWRVPRKIYTRNKTALKLIGDRIVWRKLACSVCETNLNNGGKDMFSRQHECVENWVSYWRAKFCKKLTCR